MAKTPPKAQKNKKVATAELKPAEEKLEPKKEPAEEPKKNTRQSLRRASRVESDPVSQDAAALVAQLGTVTQPASVYDSLKGDFDVPAAVEQMRDWHK